MTEPSRGASGGCAGGNPVCPAASLPRERPQHRPGTPVTVTFLLSAVAEGMGGLHAFPCSTALCCPAICQRVISGRPGLICLSFGVRVRTFSLLGCLALDMLRVLLRCAHCWGAQSCDGHKQRPQNPGQPQAPLLPAGKAVAARPGRCRVPAEVRPVSGRCFPPGWRRSREGPPGSQHCLRIRYCLPSRAPGRADARPADAGQAACCHRGPGGLSTLLGTAGSCNIKTSVCFHVGGLEAEVGTLLRYPSSHEPRLGWPSQCIANTG